MFNMFGIKVDVQQEEVLEKEEQQVDNNEKLDVVDLENDDGRPTTTTTTQRRTKKSFWLLNWRFLLLVLFLVIIGVLIAVGIYVHDKNNADSNDDSIDVSFDDDSSSDIDVVEDYHDVEKDFYTTSATIIVQHMSYMTCPSCTYSAPQSLIETFNDIYLGETQTSDVSNIAVRFQGVTTDGTSNNIAVVDVHVPITDCCDTTWKGLIASIDDNNTNDDWSTWSDIDICNYNCDGNDEDKKMHHQVRVQVNVKDGEGDETGWDLLHDYNGLTP